MYSVVMNRTPLCDMDTRIH